MKIKSMVPLLAVCLLACVAHAAPVPPGIDAALKNLKLQSRSLENGVLRVVMSVPLVSPDMYHSAILLVCGEQWRAPKQLASTRLDRIEVLNSVDAQGFALPGGKKTCDQLAMLPSTRVNEEIQAMAERCEAGVCRPRK